MQTTSSTITPEVEAVVIDLVSRPRYGAECVEMLRAVGIRATIEAAVDGHTDKDPEIVVCENHFRRFNKGRPPLPGEIGCYASHLRIARRALAGEIPPISPLHPDWFLVFEDDAKIRGDVTGKHVLEWASQARDRGLDYVWLHSGSKDRRNHGPSIVGVKYRSEIMTHAALVSLRGFRIISEFQMCHPVDLAFSRSKKLRMGVLWGQANFVQRRWAPAIDAIAWERRGGGKDGMKHPRKIVAGLHCGLGNQMFQIAAAASLAAQYGLEMEAAPCAHYRVPQGFAPTKYKDTIFRTITLLSKIGKGVALPEKSFTYRKVELPRESGRAIMGGWWQSAKHQEHVNVKELFDFSWYDDTPVRDLKSKFDKPLCAVHFRGGDFSKDRSRYICREAYYAPIIKKMAETHAIILVTDDSTRARQEIPSFDHLLSGGDDAEDLAFMIACDAIVIGNSTFAWWAARLGNHTEVHAPAIWFAHGHPKHRNDINMDEWIKHPVHKSVRSLSRASLDEFVATPWNLVAPSHIPVSVSGNLGDAIQSEVACRLWGVREYVSRDAPLTWPEDAVVPLIGWYGRGAAPLSFSSRAVIVGFHCAPRAAAHLKKNAAWFREQVRSQGFPAFCRDIYTRDLLRDAGVDAEFGGCVTLSLPPSRLPRAGSMNIDQQHVNLKHMRWSHSQRLQAGARQLERFSQVGSVLTPRMHAWLPCLALGTPATLTLPSAASDPRFSGYNIRATLREDIFGSDSLLPADIPQSIEDLLGMLEPCKGVIQVGAHHGQEVPAYLQAGIKVIALVEPDPGNFETLSENFPTGIQLFHTALGENPGPSDFHVSNKGGQSSSLLRPKKHLRVFPSVKFGTITQVMVTRMDDLALDFTEFDLLVMDVQGGELGVLRGASEVLRNFKAIITEFHTAEFYEGCALLRDLDAFLTPLGFRRKAEIWRGKEWGDALYVREQKSLPDSV